MVGRKTWRTMADVAREAGVSKITVSRVIRTPEKVALATRDRVRAAILSLGYVPDETAGRLASGVSNTVGALFPTLAGSALAPTIDGLTRQLRKNGHELLLGNTDYSMEVEANLIPAILSWRPAGLILTSTEHTEKVRTMLGRSSVPTIEIWELPDDPIDMAVGYSNFAAGYEMARFLYDTERRNIAFIGGTSRTVRTRLRRGGYLKALEDVGGTVPPEVPFDRGIPSIVERAAAGMDWIFKNCPDVDAVLCMNDWTAMGVISEVWRHGKSVPGDIAVSGFGDVDFGKTRGLGITTVGIPGFKVGETAARLILERVRNSNSEPKVIDLGFEIIRRATA